MQEYQRLLNKFKAAGIKVISISPDRPAINKKTRGRFKLGFPIYTDADNGLAKKLGIAFKLGPNSTKIYKEKFKIDLVKSQGSPKNELPFPGVYVVDKAGVIKFAYVDDNYKKRISPAKVLKIAKKINQ